MGVILGVFIALGLVIVVAIVSFKHMWDSAPGYEHMPVVSKAIASLFFLGMILTIAVAIIYACNR